MAGIHENSHCTRAEKEGQLSHIILFRIVLFSVKCLRTEIVWSLAAQTGKIIASGACFPAKKMFRDVRCTSSGAYGSTLDKVGCGNTLSSCKSVLLHRLPKDVGAGAVLRKKWLAKIPRENTPLTPNSYICGIHFPADHPDEENDSPSIFLG